MFAASITFVTSIFFITVPQPFKAELNIYVEFFSFCRAQSDLFFMCSIAYGDWLDWNVSHQPVFLMSAHIHYVCCKSFMPKNRKAEQKILSLTLLLYRNACTEGYHFIENVFFFQTK